MRRKYIGVSFQRTMYACFIGYVVQAVVNNFVPLLFVMFQDSYQIPLSKITLLITVNFIFQLVIDMLSAGFVDRIGYKAAIMIAHICAAVGLVSLTILPEVFSDPFIGILLAVMIYAVGGGLLEVLVSPIMEACPTPNKEKAMSLLHSFYCWGHMGVVLLSTAFFSAFGISNWKILALIWALIPAVNCVLFFTAPIYSLQEEGERGLSVKELLSKGIFWVMVLLMVASTFAEQGLKVSKTVGDLAGPMAFAFMMGLSRLFYGKYGDRINLDGFMSGSAVLCVVSYLCISFAPLPVLSLAGCAVCGFSVGILWPGTFSKAAAAIKGGGTAMFAFFALAGDLGCSAGPTLAGFVSSHFGNNLRTGILAAIIFPLLLIVGMVLSRKVKQ